MLNFFTPAAKSSKSTGLESVFSVIAACVWSATIF
jgi:hypothetical protein